MDGLRGVMMQTQNENQKGLDSLVSLEDVARALGLCVRSVRRMIDRGELPQPVRVGRAVRMFQSEVNAYMQKLREQRAG